MGGRAGSRGARRRRCVPSYLTTESGTSGTDVRRRGRLLSPGRGQGQAEREGGQRVNMKRGGGRRNRLYWFFANCSGWGRGLTYSQLISNAH